MVRKLSMFAVILVAMFLGSVVAPASAQPDTGRGAGGQYSERTVTAMMASIACGSLGITRNHVVAVNSMVKADAEAAVVLVRFNPAIQRLPAAVAAAPMGMRPVFGLLLAQFTQQRDQLVSAGASVELYASIVGTSDSILTFFPHIMCT